VLCTVTYLKSPQKVRQVDNVLIDAGSRTEAGSQIQAGVFRSLVLIEAGGFYLRFYGKLETGGANPYISSISPFLKPPLGTPSPKKGNKHAEGFSYTVLTLTFRYRSEPY